MCDVDACLSAAAIKAFRQAVHVALPATESIQMLCLLVLIAVAHRRMMCRQCEKVGFFDRSAIWLMQRDGPIG